MFSLSSSGRVVVRCAILASSLPVAIHAQTAPQPRFDVSTVRASGPSAGNGSSVSQDRQSLKASNVTLAMLIKLAYGLNDDQISGGPSWLASRRFDVAAKADSPIDPKLPPETAGQTQRLMMQHLLEERFQLKVHHETREIPGYVLTVAKGGTKGMQADEGGKQGMSLDDASLRATAITMDQLAYVLGLRVLQCPVSNTTAITGRFDLQLTWDRRTMRDDSMPNPPPDLGPSIFLALQQQLGLRLEPHKTPADAIVIDSAQLPQEN